MLPCARRNVISLIDRKGNASEVLRCAHVDCERFTKTVNEGDCSGCVMRVPSNRITACSIDEGEKDFAEPTRNPDGSLTYPKTGWEPPRVPKGYKASESDPWTMLPLWPACADRELHARKLSCGCVEMNAICASPASGKEGRLVVLTDCEVCPVRKT